MFLKYLTIEADGEVIRHIPFHKGINLIVDESSSGIKTESGNSVGKTTVLRLIDFCLGGSGKNIYTDSEFKKTNKEIEDFLTTKNVLITLCLIQDIDNPNSSKIKISRNFLSYSHKIQKINDEQIANDAFQKKLKELIFHSTQKNPTFKQLKSKNIRDEKDKLNNTIRVLAANVVTDAAYEALHLFWFGIDLGLSKDELVKNRNSETKLQSRLRQEGTLSSVTQALIVVQSKIHDFTQKKSLYDLNDKYEEDLSRLNQIKFQKSKTSGEITRLEIRRDMINESCKKLSEKTADIDTAEIRDIYDKAELLIPNLQKSFEDVLSFHNQMIENRINFISEELNSISDALNSEMTNLGELIEEESLVNERVHDVEKIESLEVVIANLNSLHEQKGRLEKQKELWQTSNLNLKKVEDDIGSINSKIEEKDHLIEQRISQFNKFFADISERLYGVSAVLSADKDEEHYKFEVTNIERNPGTGKKKSQMAAFDLAYIMFADQFEIPCLHFVLQDQIENVHSNQISNLLNNIVGEVNCQYVLPVLRDKLDGADVDIEKLKVLSLSEADKLFRV